MKTPTILFAAIASIALLSPCWSAFITPQAVSVSNGEDSAEGLIHCLGFTNDPATAESTHDPATNLMWSGVETINSTTMITTLATRATGWK